MTNIREKQVGNSYPLWMDQVLADLARHEGYREYAYPDPLSSMSRRYIPSKYRWGFRPASVIMKELGITDVSTGAPWTVGYGFTHGVKHTSRTTRAEARDRLRVEVLDHAKGLGTLLPGWRTSQPLVAQTVLVNLIFNLGTTKLSKFAPTLALFRSGDYKGAAARLKNTAWAKQVGSRAAELIKRLETGVIEDKHKI